jgi:uracil-DNA glycosylase
MTEQKRAIPAAEFGKLLDHTIDHLAGERRDGRMAMQVSPETRAGLTAPLPRAPAASVQGPDGGAVSPSKVRMAPAAPPPPPPAGGGSLDEIAREIAGCTRCPLHTTRTRTVPGVGSPRAELMFIGEGPGAEEDRQGLPFVGPAGDLLTRLIVRMGFTREEVFIANIVKCRPTVDGLGQRDRAPDENEMRACIPYLERQIAAIAPRVIVALGNTAMKGLLGEIGITRLRGHWREYRGVPLMPTYHPAYLLRGGGDEKARYWEVWDDMQQVLAKLGRTAPPRS